MDGPPPHEQARRPECTAPRYINDVTAAEIYESRVCEDRTSLPRPPPGLHTSRDCFGARANPRQGACTGENTDCVTTNARGTVVVPLEIGSPVDKRWEMKGLVRVQLQRDSFRTLGNLRTLSRKKRDCVPERNALGTQSSSFFLFFFYRWVAYCVVPKDCRRYRFSSAG